MRVSCFSFLTLLGTTLSAAPFITVHCGSPTGLPVSISTSDTSTSCSSYEDGSSSRFINGGARASGQVVLTLASNPADYSVLTTSQSAVAYQAYVPGTVLGVGNAANIEIDYSNTITTAGSERPGYLQISPDSSGTAQRAYSGSSSMTSGLEINPIVGPYYDPNRPVTEVHCDSFGQCDPTSPYLQNHYSLIPVTLGVPVILLASGMTYNYVDAGEGLSGGGLSTTFQFRFFEADQTTPVAALTTAPEPSACVSLAGAIAALAFFRRRGKVLL